MKGIVQGLSRNKVRAAVRTEYGYTVIDIEFGEVSHGDILTGNLDDHGDQQLMNQTSGQTISVYTEAIQASKSAAESLLRCI